METTKLTKQDFLDILFNDRNKDYGAYDLRRRYDKRVRNAVMGMGGIVLLIIGGYGIGTRLMAGEKSVRPLAEIYELPEMTDVEIEKPPVIPPPTRVEPPAASKPTVQHVTFAVVPNEQVNPEDEPRKNSELTELTIGVKTADGDINGSDNGAPEGFGSGGNDVVEAPKAEDRETPVTFVEFMPEFPGGEKALVNYLSRNIHYPSMASETGIEGTVFIKFVVGSTGEIRDVEVVGAKKGAGLEEEAIRVVKKMPKWKPGKQNGQAVAVYFNLPIRFTLNPQ
jgi:periplasmic protein TonB